MDRAQSTAPYVVVLAKDGASPVPPESDDEKIKDEKKQELPKIDADVKNDKASKHESDAKTDQNPDKKDKDEKDDKSAASADFAIRALRKFL